MPEAEEGRRIAPFADWLTKQRKGTLNTEAGHRLNELVEAVREVGKKGTLTITLTVAPGRGTSLEITDDVKVKLPEWPRETALWFADRDHNLTRKDPDQDELPGLAAVEGGDDTNSGESRKEDTA